VAQHPFLAGPHPRAMAHRGWHTGGTAGLENTLVAFTRAVAEGYAYVETDAQATADGHVVLHHDLTLGRTTTSEGAVGRLTLREVGEVLVGGREPVPTLREVLTALPGVRLNLDLKTDAAVLPVLAVLEATDAWHRVCLASFSESRLERVRRLAGRRLLTALGPRSVAALRARSVLPVALPATGLPRGDVVQVPVGVPGVRLVDRRLVHEAHRGGREVHVWTVDDRTSMVRLLDLGVDGIITDAPDVLQEVLEVRGERRHGA
jgi:glycerophosphoryl diester phosphodiesterase